MNPKIRIIKQRSVFINAKQYTNEIIDMYCNQNLNTVQIARIIGCNNTTIGKILRKNDIPRVHTPNELNLTDDEMKDICERYINGETTGQISKSYKICDRSVAKILKANNIMIKPAKRYSKIKNHNYFENVDSIDKAYFLGWMISDGAIIESKTRNNRTKVVSLEIQNNDKYILELFAKSLDADPDVVKVFNKRNHAHIRFASEKMANDLKKYGVVPRKSFITFLPILDDDLMPHLIRGIFDGDGTITIDKQGCGHFAFYGSEKLCTQIREYLHMKIGLNKNKVSKSTCYHVWYGGKKPVEVLKQYMYQNCGEYYLKRKYLKFQEAV